MLLEVLELLAMELLLRRAVPCRQQLGHADVFLKWLVLVPMQLWLSRAVRGGREIQLGTGV